MIESDFKLLVIKLCGTFVVLIIRAAKLVNQCCYKFSFFLWVCKLVVPSKLGNNNRLIR